MLTNNSLCIYIEILISHYEHFILHIFAFILCLICKYNFVSNGRSHYYPGSGCSRCKGVDFQIIYMDVVEWSRALDVRLSEWCCSVTMVWVQIPSREEQKFDSYKI